MSSSYALELINSKKVNRFKLEVIIAGNCTTNIPFYPKCTVMTMPRIFKVKYLSLNNNCNLIKKVTVEAHI